MFERVMLIRVLNPDLKLLLILDHLLTHHGMPFSHVLCCFPVTADLPSHPADGAVLSSPQNFVVFFSPRQQQDNNDASRCQVH